MMFVHHWKHSPPLPGNGDSFTVLYVDNVRTSLEAQSSTACYGDSFTSYHNFIAETSGFWRTCTTLKISVNDIVYRPEF
jgi:hypothetical protein